VHPRLRIPSPGPPRAAILVRLHSGAPDRSSGVVVAIDGPAGSGKSTVARLLAARLGFRFLDSGALYRSLTWKALRGGTDPSDGAGCARLLDGSRIELEDAGGSHRVLLDGDDVSLPIRGPEVTAAVSQVAAHADVRDRMVPRQRAYAARGGGVVAEGRDMGTVIFPDAAVKFFLDASPEERARRRALQSGEPEEEVREAMASRDRKDTTREIAPLRIAPDAVLVDTTGLDVDGVLALLLAEVRRRLGGA
jgi:cytidylate kinase